MRSKKISKREQAIMDFHEKLNGLSLGCYPCAHCAGKPKVFHQDYIGDSYVGDQYCIECSVCGISTDFDDWKIVQEKWNKRDG
jgi:hypothetical protein